MKAELIFKHPNTLLGEGPVWDHQQNVLWWVDIELGILHEFKPGIKGNRSFKIGKLIGAAVPRKEKGLVMAVEDGFAFFDPQTSNLEMIEYVEDDLKENRFNDGKCDSKGRFWAGTMEIDPVNPNGSLYCFSPDTHKTEKKFDQIYISNGIAWPKDDSLMYFIDSLRYKVQAFRYDADTGNIKFQRDLIKFDPNQGTPDGMTIDSNNNIWVAFYDGAKVCCYNPLNGVLLDQIDIPAQRPTSCTFGGENLDILYITTAAKEGDPKGGGLFSAKPGVIGLKANYFGS